MGKFCIAKSISRKFQKHGKKKIWNQRIFSSEAVKPLIILQSHSNAWVCLPLQEFFFNFFPCFWKFLKLDFAMKKIAQNVRLVPFAWGGSKLGLLSEMFRSERFFDKQLLSFQTFFSGRFFFIGFFFSHTNAPCRNSQVMAAFNCENQQTQEVLVRKLKEQIAEVCVFQMVQSSFVTISQQTLFSWRNQYKLVSRWFLELFLLPWALNFLITNQKRMKWSILLFFTQLGRKLNFTSVGFKAGPPWFFWSSRHSNIKVEIKTKSREEKKGQ